MCIRVYKNILKVLRNDQMPKTLLSLLLATTVLLFWKENQYFVLCSLLKSSPDSKLEKLASNTTYK